MKLSYLTVNIFDIHALIDIKILHANLFRYSRLVSWSFFQAIIETLDLGINSTISCESSWWGS